MDPLNERQSLDPERLSLNACARRGVRRRGVSGTVIEQDCHCAAVMVRQHCTSGAVVSEWHSDPGCRYPVRITPGDPQWDAVGGPANIWLSGQAPVVDG